MIRQIFVSGKYIVRLPNETFNRLQSEGKRLIVCNQPGPRTRYLAVFVHDNATHAKVLLGRYMLKAKPGQNLRFKDGNRLNHDPENIYLEEK